MSGKLPVNIKKYFSIDETITSDQGILSFPFRLTRLLDIVRNDGPDNAIITLDNGDPITLDPGDYIGPWDGFVCSIITISCPRDSVNPEEIKTCRVRALGV